VLFANHVDREPGGFERNVEHVDEFEKFLFGARQAKAVTRQQHGPLGTIQRFDDFGDLGIQRIGSRWRLRTSEAGERRLIDRRRLHVQRDIDPHRSGTSALGEIKRLFEVVADALRIVDRDRVLGDRLDDGDDVHFLDAHLPDTERSAIRTEHAIGTLHLPGNEDARRGIEPRPSHAGDRIRASGSRGDQADAEMVGAFRVILRGDCARLLVQVTDVFDFLAAGERVIEVHGATSNH